MTVFTQEQWLAAPLAEVFLWFAAPANLLRITPAEAKAHFSREHLVAPLPRAGIDTSKLAGVGSEITVAVRPLPWLPLRQHWTARIVEFEWDHHFRDVQIGGPMREFDHTHTFKAETRDGVSGTLVSDRITFRTGWGPWADAFARRRLEQLFAYRRAELDKLFPAR